MIRRKDSVCFDSRDTAGRRVLDAILPRAEIFVQHSRDALSNLMHPADIANGRVSSMHNLADHP